MFSVILNSFQDLFLQRLRFRNKFGMTSMTAMNKVFFFLLFLIVIFLEGTITTIPLVLSALLIIYILKRESWIFPLGFVCGIILDLLTVRVVGQTSMFFILFFLIIALYERKFEVTTLPFIFIASFSGSILYEIFFYKQLLFIPALANSIFAVFLFYFFSRFQNLRKNI